jgi:hypothetical protein
MDFSKLDARRVLAGAISSGLLLLGLFLLPWYSLADGTENVARQAGGASFNPDAFICGTGDFKCTGFETFPIMRWVLVLAAVAPLILAYILVRSHRLSYPPGEMTMVAGFGAMILILYNGIIDKPGTGIAEAGVSLDYGYFVALIGAIGIGLTGFYRSQAGQRQVRKAPGNV